MSLLDWIVVLALNGSIILFAVWWSGRTKTSEEYFLAARTLPWWMIGLSLYATFIDVSDLVVDSGGAYQFGLRMFVLNWLGVVGGWFLLAHVVAVPMYRAGMFTNAEYLEARFSLAARVISVVVQVQYRTMVLGIMARSLFLTLTIVLGFAAPAAWTTVVAVALVAIAYTITGGLRAVALTDALQSVVMFLASFVIFMLVYNQVGGWSGVHERLHTHDPAEAAHILEIGHPRLDRTDTTGMSPEQIDNLLLLGGEHAPEDNVVVRRTPAWIFCLSLVIAGAAYSIVNHTQAMRVLAARSEWDSKMSVVVAGGALVVMTFVNLSMGIMGRALHPDVSVLDVPEAVRGVDSIYPVLVRDLTVSGLRGVVVAGVMAAAFCTFDSVGSALSALVTRDIYARLFVTNADDRHYLRVGRWVTPAIILGSFLYLPLLDQGMFAFYLEMVAAFVTPLLTVYVMGALVPVHRSSATAGLLVGVAYGIWGLVAAWAAVAHGVQLLPQALANPHVVAPMSVLITAGTMLLVSVLLGWTSPRDLLREETTPWLRATQGEIRHDAEAPSGPLPLVLGAIVMAAALLLTFVVFW